MFEKLMKQPWIPEQCHPCASSGPLTIAKAWIPAFAGMTVVAMCSKRVSFVMQSIIIYHTSVFMPTIKVAFLIRKTLHQVENSVFGGDFNCSCIALQPIFRMVLFCNLYVFSQGKAIPKAYGFEAATHYLSILLGGSLKRRTAAKRSPSLGMAVYAISG